MSPLAGIEYSYLNPGLTIRHGLSPSLRTLERRFQFFAIGECLKKPIQWQGQAIVWHRWLGIATCVLFLFWYVSGIVMIYARMPTLDASDRLKRLPELTAASITVSPTAAWQTTTEVETWRQVVLTTITDRPAYRFLTAKGDRIVSYADRPQAQRSFTQAEAETSLRTYLGNGKTFEWQPTLKAPDQWTVQRLYTDHLPLYHAALNDPASTEVYLSSRTGEVILETTRSSRLLAWAGAIPHWIYLRAIRVFAEEWRLGVITISFIGAFMSVLGIVVGIWRYSPSRKYRNRELGPQPTPYSGAKKLHHYTGLAFGLLTFTFILSGAFSLNPGRWSTGSAPSAAQANIFTGGPLRLAAFDSLPVLPNGAREVEFQQIAGTSVQRVISAPSSTSSLWTTLAGQPFAPPSQPELIAAAARAVPGSTVQSTRLLTEYETYYYDRKYRKPLPVLEVVLNDPAKTWFYVDPSSGLPVNRYEWSGRWERWVYHGLHSLDFPGLWQIRPLWDITVILVSLGGIFLSWSGVQIGWERIRPRRRLTSPRPVISPVHQAGD
ncbi:MAG: hypothetical protein FJW30_14495 [Acidobacteria bacterium]|nr:hypothetical protein [Acidobacteriota bacterium]